MNIPSIKEIEVFLMLKYGQDIISDIYVHEPFQPNLYRIILSRVPIQKLTGVRILPARVFGWSKIDEDHAWIDAYQREMKGQDNVD